MIGQTLSHFEITAKLGEGGMGEVYRATDLKLGREVAIKILPQEFTEDELRLARFEREAKMLASLNHGNIAAIHEIGGQEGIHFLVMELADGETLADRISCGPMPIEEALPLALQIAEALEAAHDQGVIHRDLKPSNVMVTTAGEAKILDFGLAKALEPEASSDEALDASRSPTLTGQMTGVGVLLGTARYMSPEQARGAAADRRSDIWAFGLLLMEMLTGRAVYGADTMPDTLAGVLATDPDWEALPARTPRRVRQLLERCLEKDPKNRLQAIGEARIAISRYLADPDAEEEAAAHPVAARAGWQRAVGRGVGILVLIGATAASTLLVDRRLSDERLVRASILPPQGAKFHLESTKPGPAVISPDGRMATFSAVDAEGSVMLYLQRLDAATARALPGTEGARYPFWSPDSRDIGFFANGKLKRVAVGGESPFVICEAPAGKGGAWNRDGLILFAPDFNAPLHQVSAAGGPSAPITRLDVERGDNSHRHPRFLPDGRRFLYLARIPGRPAGNAVLVGSLSNGDHRILLDSPVAAAYASGHLLFVRDRTLMARPFEPGRLEFAGEAVALVEDILVIGGSAQAVFSASEEGTLLYQTGSLETSSTLDWRDRGGAPSGSLGNPDLYQEASLSPDGSRAVVRIIDSGSGTSDQWIMEIAGGVGTRFTFDAAMDVSPVWSPDGDTIVFSSNRGGRYNLYRKSVGGLSAPELLLASSTDDFPSGWSRDGELLAYTRLEEGGAWDLWILPLDGDRQPYPFVQSPFHTLGGAFSPDGRWLAYASDESGRWEVYVVGFPEPRRRRRVSAGGGLYPRWRADGREILYHEPSGRLVAAAIDVADDEIVVGRSEPLFEIAPSTPDYRRFSATPDHERFLVVTLTGQSSATPLSLALHWQRLLEQD